MTDNASSLEKIDHSYTVKARAIADTFNMKGRIMRVDSETFEFKEGDTMKTGYKVVFRTVEEIDTTQLTPTPTEE